MTHEEFITSVAAEFELAYITTGLKPVRRSWGDGTTNGCMVTALDAGEHGSHAATTLDEELRFADHCVGRVTSYLHKTFGRFDIHWWKTFVAYCIRSFDATATFPRQWMKRNRYTKLEKASPKSMGAAVGGLVYRYVTSTPKEEIVPAAAPKKTTLVGAEAREQVLELATF